MNLKTHLNSGFSDYFKLNNFARQYSLKLLLFFKQTGTWVAFKIFSSKSAKFEHFSLSTFQVKLASFLSFFFEELSNITRQKHSQMQVELVKESFPRNTAATRSSSFFSNANFNLLRLRYLSKTARSKRCSRYNLQKKIS